MIPVRPSFRAMRLAMKSGMMAAEAIVDWFDLHGASEDGWVSFRQWPDGMRGHFIARMPPDIARFEEDG